VLLLAVAGIWVDRSRDTDLADPNANVTAALRLEVPEGAPELRFAEVAGEAGIDFVHGPGRRSRRLPEDTGSGLAWGDYDGDGDHDLYVVSFAGPFGEAGPGVDGGNRLYRNDGARFVDVTESAGVADKGGFGMGAGFVDHDGDGDLDLYVTNVGANRLFRNRGDGGFDEVAAELGLDEPRWSVAAVWADFDRDGRLDVYLANYVRFDASVGAGQRGEGRWETVPLTLNPNVFGAEENALLLQRDDGGFEDVARPWGVANPGGRSLGATAVDVDDDGWLDLYVANDVSPNALFRSLGGELDPEAGFEDWSAATGTADPRGSMGISVVDLALDGGVDGLPDLFITHWVTQENALYRGFRGPDGLMEYRDRAQMALLGQVSTDRVGWGSAFADLDLDGLPDLLVANGSTLESGDPPQLEAQAPFVFWNEGERFHDLAPLVGGGFAEPVVARGLAVADYDLDGDVDVAMSLNRGPLRLFRNDSPDRGASSTVELRASAVLSRGARVSVAVGAAGPKAGQSVAEPGPLPEAGQPPAARQNRWVGADVSFASAHAAESLFGLGGDPGPVDVQVRWTDGRRTVWRGLPADRRLVVSAPPDG
jgi:hypothetical protein